MRFRLTENTARTAPSTIVIMPRIRINCPQAASCRKSLQLTIIVPNTPVFVSRQLSSALEVIRGLGLHELPVIGLAKREEEIFTEGSHESIMLDRESASLHLIQRIRDEAHRFAITYHRKLRGKRNLRSVLDHIEGIGPKRRQALWLKFKSIDAIKAASVEELADTESMNYPAAQKIYDFFRMDLPEKAEVLKN